MNQVDENINNDMVDTDLIDVDSLSFSDDQTWLYVLPSDSGRKVDIVDWNLSYEWPIDKDKEYLKLEKELYSLLDNIIKDDVHAPVDRQKFDSRTFVRSKRRPQRPSIQNMVDVVNASHLQSIPQNSAVNSTSNKYLTYNKYNAHIGPMLRLKTFNVDVNTENSGLVKEFATKRKTFVQDDDPQLEEVEVPHLPGSSGRQSLELEAPSRPINIDLSQPAYNLHNTFNKGFTNAMNDRNSLNMSRSGESLMRMSPPSLVNSLMEGSGNFNRESLDGKRSLTQHDSLPGVPTGRESVAGRGSVDPSMTLSILDEKDMSTSFLSQTTYPDDESLMDSFPPSLINSFNSSFIISNPKHRTDSQPDTNIFSSATFTNLENSERLLSSRPRCQQFNSITKREVIAPSESYTKSREEGCQIETPTKDAPTQINSSGSKTETITLHYSNVKFNRDEAEKENINSTFEKDDAFYRDNDMQDATFVGRSSLNVTLDKQELNEIIQARQKLSLARKALPSEDKTLLPNQADTSPIKTIQLPNQTITVPRRSMENASELLSKRRSQNGYEKTDDATNVKRCATFKKLTSPKIAILDKAMPHVKSEDVIDINTATLNLIDPPETSPQQKEWCAQERAMVCSSESTDTGTFSSSSPPESVPASIESRHQIISSTPLALIKKGIDHLAPDLTSISPIFDTNSPNTPAVTGANTAVNTKSRPSLAASSGNLQGQRRLSPTSLCKPVPSLLTSKLRQYSSHKELNRIPAGPAATASRLPAGLGTMSRRNVYASNPVLNPPTMSATPSALPKRCESYTSKPPSELVKQLKGNKPPPTTPASMAPPTPALVRQGTETLRRERPPQGQIVPPRDRRSVPAPVVVQNAIPTPVQRNVIPSSASRGYSALPTSQMRLTRPSSGPTQKPSQVTYIPDTRPQSSNNDARVSSLPRPSRLPAPRRGLRPPSVYSVAPSSDNNLH